MFDSGKCVGPEGISMLPFLKKETKNFLLKNKLSESAF